MGACFETVTGRAAAEERHYTLSAQGAVSRAVRPNPGLQRPWREAVAVYCKCSVCRGRPEPCV